MADNAVSMATKSMLEDHVKKGKVRKFVLICKGAAIQTLVVFKKGPYGTQLMAAKKAGFRGQAYCGVITGKGKKIVMQLPGTSEVAKIMKADGGAVSEPCKIAKLRAFLTEEGGVAFKPEFDIVLGHYGLSCETSVPSPRYPAGLPASIRYKQSWGDLTFGVTNDDASQLVRFVMTTNGD